MTNTPADHGWTIVQRGQAVGNALYLAAVSRVGSEPSPDGRGGIGFWGSSFVTDLDGKIVAQASVDKPELLLCSIDVGAVKAVRKRFSFLFRDRRVDAMGT